jgi:hypothetical protein
MDGGKLPRAARRFLKSCSWRPAALPLPSSRLRRLPSSWKANRPEAVAYMDGDDRALPTNATNFFTVGSFVCSLQS